MWRHVHIHNNFFIYLFIFCLNIFIHLFIYLIFSTHKLSLFNTLIDFGDGDTGTNTHTHTHTDIKPQI